MTNTSIRRVSFVCAMALAAALIGAGVAEAASGNVQKSAAVGRLNQKTGGNAYMLRSPNPKAWRTATIGQKRGSGLYVQIHEVNKEFGGSLRKGGIDHLRQKVRGDIAKLEMSAGQSGRNFKIESARVSKSGKSIVFTARRADGSAYEYRAALEVRGNGATATPELGKIQRLGAPRTAAEHVTETATATATAHPVEAAIMEELKAAGWHEVSEATVVAALSEQASGSVPGFLRQLFSREARAQKKAANTARQVQAHLEQGAYSEGRWVQNAETEEFQFIPGAELAEAVSARAAREAGAATTGAE
jgi:hypothetical protein